MKRRMFGATDLSLHEIGFGAMQLSIDAEKRPSEEDAVQMIQDAVEKLQIDFIDTADAYCIDEEEKGHNERLIAKALGKEQKNQVFIATKGGCIRPNGEWKANGRPEHLRGACEASLKALDVERIDLYQLHRIDPDVPMEESVGALADLQREGKIRYIGLSNFSLEQLKQGMKEAPIASLQNRYSVMNRGSQDPIIDFCEEEKICFIPWNPVGGRGNAPNIGSMYKELEAIASAHETSPHAIALAWLLQRSPVIIPIPGTRSLAHLREDTTASELELTDDEIERLNSLDEVSVEK